MFLKTLTRTLLAPMIAALICSHAQAAPATAPAAAAPMPTPLESSDGSLRIVDLIKETRSIIDGIQSAANQPVAPYLERIDAILEHLAEIDATMQAPLSHWTWTSVGRVPLEDEKDQEKFVIDPPLENGSAIAFQCHQGRVRIESIKVIDANGISTVFNVERSFDEDQKQKEVLYMYYPTAISTIIVSYASERDARQRLNVWAGVTDLPEFAKEATYWFTLARNELRLGESAKATERLKNAAVKLYLFRFSRKIQ